MQPGKPEVQASAQQASECPNQRHLRRSNSLTSSQTYLNQRKLHADERVVFEGPLKIEDRTAAQKGQILLKDRYAVLCQSRILLFKNEREARRERHSDALAVYPIAHAAFLQHEAPPLTEYNFSSRKSFQAQIDNLRNYMKFVRMSFQVSQHMEGSTGIQRRIHSRANSQGKASGDPTYGHNRDLYFGNKTEIWLNELLLAKKRLHDQINLHSSPQNTLLDNSLLSPSKSSIRLRAASHAETLRRQREESFVQRVLGNIVSFFGCTSCQDYRQSGEIRLSSANNSAYVTQQSGTDQGAMHCSARKMRQSVNRSLLMVTSVHTSIDSTHQQVPSAFKHLMGTQNINIALTSSPEEARLVTFEVKQCVGAGVPQPSNSGLGTPIPTMEDFADTTMFDAQNKLLSLGAAQITKVDLSRYNQDSLTEAELQDQEAKPMLCGDMPRQLNAWPKYTTTTAEIDSACCTMSIENISLEDEAQPYSKFARQQSLAGAPWQNQGGTGSGSMRGACSASSFSSSELSVIEECKSDAKSTATKPTPLTEQRKAVSFISQADVVAAMSPATERGTLDARLIRSEKALHLAKSTDKSQANSSKTARTRLGESAIKRIELHQLINCMFDQEYDPKQIDRRCQARRSRRDFDFNAQDLGMYTDLPGRLFEILETFVSSQNVPTPRNFSPIIKAEDRSLFGKPSEHSRARLIDAIHFIEDIFVSYAQDVVNRVIRDLNSQEESRMKPEQAFRESLTSTGHVRLQGPRIFLISHSLAISTSLLLNDLQAFADRYSLFRQNHVDYFDLTDEEIRLREQQQKSRQLAQVDSPMSDASQSISEDFNSGGTAQIPCDPELTKCYECLHIINEFRFSGNVALLDELMLVWNATQSSDDCSSFSSRHDSILQSSEPNSMSRGGNTSTTYEPALSEPQLPSDVQCPSFETRVDTQSRLGYQIAQAWQPSLPTILE